MVSGSGLYTDFSFNFVVAGPAAERPLVIQPFDATLMTGAGSFAIDSNAPGPVQNGQIVFTYDLFSTSPNSLDFNPGTDTISLGNFLAAPASVTVNATSPVPEPAGLPLSGSALLALWLRRRSRR